MEKKIINKILIIIGLAIVLIGCFFFFKKYSQPSIIYYYGQDCPACLNVEKFLKENRVEAKLVFEKKEVYYNQKNALELTKRVRICGIQSNEIPVPLLWTGLKCIIGDEGIINFFKEKIRG